MPLSGRNIQFMGTFQISRHNVFYICIRNERRELSYLLDVNIDKLLDN